VPPLHGDRGQAQGGAGVTTTERVTAIARAENGRHLIKLHKEFDRLRRRWSHAWTAEQSYIDALKAGKYAWCDRHAMSVYVNKTERARMDKLSAGESKASDAFFDFLYTSTPRGRAWSTGISAYWLLETLTFEEAMATTPPERATKSWGLA
jgi:hypothetical protein